MDVFTLWNQYKQFVDPDMSWLELKALRSQFINDLSTNKRKDRKKYIKHLKDITVPKHMIKDVTDLIHEITIYRH